MSALYIQWRAETKLSEMYRCLPVHDTVAGVGTETETVNTALVDLAAGLAAGHHEYLRQLRPQEVAKEAVILFIVQVILQ